jgi:TonB-linked SusC/RagA family outer membrane protein
MERKLLLSALMVFMLVGSAWAQSTITGVVTSEDGALPGATVQIKGTNVGTTTDIEGKYSLVVPELTKKSPILVFRFVGYMTAEEIVGTRTIIDIVMSESTELETVVVNALGFEQSSDEIGTAPSTVKGTSLVRSGEPSVINSLAGKSSGVNIVQASGDPGAGSRIQIRGASTINGNLQPLIVIDGVPMFNDSFTGAGSSYLGSGGGVTQQSRLNDLNPNDIESVEVLKSAAAAALWGSRASNGVLVITTKKGKKTDKGFTVNVRSSLSLDQINRLPELNNAYGQGDNGLFNPGSANSWGDKIADRSGGADASITEGQDGYVGYFEANDGRRFYGLARGTAANPHGGKNSREIYDLEDQLFQVGTTWNNSISLSSADDKGSIYLSFSDLDQEGIIKTNSTYRRTTARLNASRNFGTWLKGSMTSAYTRTGSNRIQTGSNLSGLFLGGLRTPSDFDQTAYEGRYVDATGNVFENRQRAYRNYLGRNLNSVYDNPLWMMENVLSTAYVDRFIGSFELNAEATSWLSFVARAGVDMYQDSREDYYDVLAAGSNQNGTFNKQLITNRQINGDFIAHLKRSFSTNIDANLFVGMNLNERRFDNSNGNVRGFINPSSPPQLSNGTPEQILASNGEEIVRIRGFYADGSVSIANQLFLQASIRNDKYSTFDKSFFFPSASAAWQFQDYLPDNNIISFAKLRASVGQVGTAPSAYITTNDYIPFSNATDGGWGGQVTAGGYGGGFRLDDTAGNPDIKPEIKTEYEIGTDLRFWDDRINLGFTYYTNSITDVILSVELPSSSGFAGTLANAASIKNRGIEIQVGADLVRTDNLTWNVYGNWTRNRNEVTDLAGTERIFLGGFTDGGSYAVQGEQLGAIWGTKWDRNEDGSLALDDLGFPQQGDVEGVIADPNPDFRAGFGTNLSYKNLSLNVLFDMSVGNQMWNGTRGALAFFGKAAYTANEVTLSAEQASSILNFDGNTVATAYPAAQQSDGSYRVRGTVQNFGGGDVFLDQGWYRNGPGSGFTGPTEIFIEDASWTRLRELTLTYNLASEAFRKTTKLQNVSLSFTGRNLILWTDYSGIDPDTNLAGAGGISNGFGIDYFNNPNTRSYIFSLNITY